MAWLVILAAAIWGLFEWRVRSENKPLMRLSALGTAAVALMMMAVLTAGSLVISFCLGVPATARLARPFALAQIAHVDTSVSALEKALAKQDWKAMEDHVNQAARAMDNLAKAAPAVPALTLWNEPPTAEELRARVKAGGEGILDMQQAIRNKDAEQIEAAVQSFHKSFAPVQEAAKRPPR